MVWCTLIGRPGPTVQAKTLLPKKRSIGAGARPNHRERIRFADLSNLFFLPSLLHSNISLLLVTLTCLKREPSQAGASAEKEITKLARVTVENGSYRRLGGTLVSGELP